MKREMEVELCLDNCSSKKNEKTSNSNCYYLYNSKLTKKFTKQDILKKQLG